MICTSVNRWKYFTCRVSREIFEKIKNIYLWEEAVREDLVACVSHGRKVKCQSHLQGSQQEQHEDGNTVFSLKRKVCKILHCTQRWNKETQSFQVGIVLRDGAQNYYLNFRFISDVRLYQHKLISRVGPKGVALCPKKIQLQSFKKAFEVINRCATSQLLFSFSFFHIDIQRCVWRLTIYRGCNEMKSALKRPLSQKSQP